MDPSVMSNCCPSTLLLGLSCVALGLPLAIASAAALVPVALVGGYVGLALGAYGTVLAAPLLPFLLPLVLVPLAPLGCGCGCHQMAPFQWRY